MRVRTVTLHDLKSLEGHGILPSDPNSPLYFYQIAVEDDNGELIGAAFVKLTTELSLVFRKDISKRKKAEALLSVWDPIEEAHAKNALNDTHVCLVGEQSESFCQILQRLGFKPATGIPMSYEGGTRKWLTKDTLSKRILRRKISRKPRQPKLEPLSEEGEPLVVPV